MAGNVSRPSGRRSQLLPSLGLAAGVCCAAPGFVAPLGTRGAPSLGARSTLQRSPPAAADSTVSHSAAAGVGAAVAGLVAARVAAGQRRNQLPPRGARQGLTARAAEKVRQLKTRERSDGHGWVKEDPEFNDTDDSVVEASHTVELKKRPSGITRYTHGIDGKGAMVMAMHEKARYPGDPLGQAAVAGVKKGFVVKSIGGEDVRGMDFEDIMDMLEDFMPDPDAQSAAKFNKEAKHERTKEAVEFPVTIEYNELKEGATQAAAAPTIAAPEGAWMPRLEPWSDEDLEKERATAKGMEDPAGYKGPRYTDPSCLNEAWIKELMEMQTKGILLPKKDAYLMVLDAIKQLKSENTLNDVSVKGNQEAHVFGDLHGQYFDLVNILGMTGMPSAEKPFIFNGDFVDRGSWSIEVILLIFALKLKDPGCVHLNRGNHEMLEANVIYGFAGETGTKYDLNLFNLFSEAFRSLPLLHLVNKEVLIVHAGLPGPRPRLWLPGQTHDPEDAVPTNEKACTLEEIRAVDRYTELSPATYREAVDESPRKEEKHETDTRMIIDFLWADPRGGVGYGPSYRKSRGVFMFGPDVTQQFVQENKLKLVIRSHEIKSEGWLYDHPTLLSVFSAPNYLDTGGNKGAVLKLTATGADGSIEVKPMTYQAVPHPDLPPMHHQNFILMNHPHLTRQMKKKAPSANDDFGDSDFAGYQGPDEWEEVTAPVPA